MKPIFNTHHVRIGLLVFTTLIFSACKFNNNAIESEEIPDSTRDLDNIPPTVNFSITPQINVSNQLNYMASGICSEEGLPVVVGVGGINLYTTCVGGLWAVSGDVSVAVDSPALYISVTQEDASNNTATHSTTILKDTVAPTVAISASYTALTIFGGSPDILATFSEAVSRNDTDVSNHGERIFLTSSVDNASVDIVSLDTPTTKLFSSFSLSSALNTVTLVTNYSPTDPQTIFFQDIAGNKVITNSNTLTFTELPYACGPANHDALFAGGNGTIATPYLVQNITQFNAIRYGDDCKYKLQNNIDASATATWNGGLGFAPMNLSAGGEIDGNNFTISHLTSNRPAQDYLSIFSSMSGTIKSITFDQLNITGKTYVSFIFSLNTGGSINNLTLSNSSVAGEYYVGGLAYEVQTGSNVNNITVNTLTLNAIQYAGIFFRNNAAISNVNISNVSVSGDHYLAGLVFENQGTLSTVAVSGLNVSGDNYLAGLFYENYGSVATVVASNINIASDYYAAGLGFRNLGDTTNLTLSSVAVTGDDYLAGGIFEVTSGTLNNTIITSGTLTGGYYLAGYAFDIRSGVIINKIFTDFTVTSLGYGNGFAYESRGTIKEAAIFSKMNRGSCVAQAFLEGLLEDAYFVCSGTPDRTIYELTGTAAFNRVYARGPKSGETLVSNGYFVDSIGVGVTVQNTYFNSDYLTSPFQSDATGSASITAKTSLELQNQTTYIGWDFATVWNIAPGPQPYPYLRFRAE